MDIQARKLIIISVLNWNSASVTLKCVRSVLALDNASGFTAEIVVTDNGSRSDDFDELRSGLEKYQVTVIREANNLGFAGGHNKVMRTAIERHADFVWLVNSDAIVEPDSLNHMVRLMESDARCGVVSPIIIAPGAEKIIDFCGARHDWQKLSSIYCHSVTDAQAMEAQYPMDMWLMGAAMMFRVSAIKQVGLLDDRLFAYFEDDDICARLAKAGWLSRMAFDAHVFHPHSNGRLKDRPAYYFYLMARNSFRFWFAHTPKPYRTLLRLKLIDRSVFIANRLYNNGLDRKADACLLGVYDGQIGKTGVWHLERRVPIIIRLLRKLLWLNHSKHVDVPSGEINTSDEKAPIS